MLICDTPIKPPVPWIVWQVGESLALVSQSNAIGHAQALTLAEGAIIKARAHPQALALRVKPDQRHHHQVKVGEWADWLRALTGSEACNRLINAKQASAQRGRGGEAPKLEPPGGNGCPAAVTSTRWPNDRQIDTLTAGLGAQNQRIGINFAIAG